LRVCGFSRCARYSGAKSQSAS